MIPALVIAHSNYTAVKKRLEELRIYGIHEIYIYVDGYNHDGNIQKLHQRTQLIEMLENELSLSKLSKVHFCETNTGVGIAVPTAVDWFFQNVEYGIILEDDCSLLPHTKEFFEDFNAEKTSIIDAVVCLSNPLPINLSHSDNIQSAFIESRLFTSWGWICSRRTWERVELKNVDLKQAIKAALVVRNISRTRSFWLCLSWIDIWFSLRKNQNRLWAFRFTVLLILSGVKIQYPVIKTVQHVPSLNGTNVHAIPEWDNQEMYSAQHFANLSPSRIQNSKLLDTYLAKNIQGASFISLLTRFAYRVLRKVKIKS